MDPDTVHGKKRFAVLPSPDGMSLTKLPLAGKNLFIPARESWVSDIRLKMGKSVTFFYSVNP